MVQTSSAMGRLHRILRAWPRFGRSLGVGTLGITAVAGCASGGRGRPGPPAGTRAELRHVIDSMVASPKFSNAHWGILIVDPERGDTLYSRNAGKLFMPASNQKIITGAVALELLGPDYQFTTTFAARGTVEGGVLRGDLVVLGRGDPSVSDAMRGGDVMQAMRTIPDSLRAHDVRYVSGRLVRAGDAFPDAWHGFGWGWDDFDAAYSAGVDELFFNEGMFQILVRGGTREGARASASIRPDIGYPSLRSLVTTTRRPDTARTDSLGRTPRLRAPTAVGDSASNVVTLTGQVAVGDSVAVSVAYRDPGLAYLFALRKTLTEQALTIEGGLDPRAPRDSSAKLDTLFVLRSPPLREILARLEKPSQNQIAEIFLKTLGLERTGVGTADSGRAVIERQLEAWGIVSTSFAVRDGSGLSRHDYLAPDAIVRVLDAMRRSPHYEVFHASLPIAGVDGTIRNRMRETPAAGNLHAKTGSVDKARSLSGYVTTADGRRLIFSVLSNNFTTTPREVEEVADVIGARLAGLRGR